MGIAPVQPDNPANRAIVEGAQLAAFGDYAPGWCLAAYVPAGVALTEPPAGGFRSVRVALGPMMRGAASRVGAAASGFGARPVEVSGGGRRLRAVLMRVLSGTVTEDAATNTSNESDGLGSKVRVLRKGDRLVVPASVTGIEGVSGDAVLQVQHIEFDQAFWSVEVSL